VRALSTAGHHVYVARGVSINAGFDDADFANAGAQIVYGSDEIYTRGDLLVTIDGVLEGMAGVLRPQQVICEFLHLAMLPQRTLAALATSGASTVSYELIQRHDRVCWCYCR
jgi:alanine dehydrogenase